MKINIVTVPAPGWVLRMLAKNWCKRLPDCTMTDIRPDPQADINFYVNWFIFNPEFKTKIDIGWFTHKENEVFDIKASQMDYCICPSELTYKLLPKNKSFILKHGIGEEFLNKKNKIKFGIVGREYGSGRKNFNIVDSLKLIPNSEFSITNGKLSSSQLVDFYKEIDYLLVTATNEGGPVPVLDALTMGVPIIAPNVGWCWEYPVIKYSSDEELLDIISSLCSFVDVDKVWNESTNELLNIFKKVYHENKYQKPNRRL